jgi:hypothetical protein
MFLQVFDFSFMHLNIDVVNILTLSFWLMEFIFKTKSSPTPKK